MPGEYTAEVTLTDALGDVSRSQVVITAYPENEPVLAVKPIYIDFGAMLPGTGASKTIHIKNEGELPLEINHISYGGDYVFEVGIPSIPLTIAPWDERIITVDFFPNIRGYYSGMISIVSNDPHNPNALVGIEGHVVDLLSILTVSPGFLLFDDGTLEQTITIGNDGNTGLSWAIVDDLPAWLTTSPREGFVHWFSPSEITVSADPTGLAEGVYTHNLQVASSGGDALVLVVLEVEAAPPPPPVLSFTAPYYSHGWVYAKRGYVSDQGIADPGPYGETSESDLHGPSETVLAYGFRGWCYPGEIGCQCDFPTLFNFPGDHPINMAGPACSPTYAGWMSSWAGLHADPLIGEISILAGAMNQGGPTLSYCIPFGGGQICYPPPAQWGGTEAYGYIRQVFQVQGGPGMSSGDAVVLQADFNIEGSTAQAIALLTRAQDVSWLDYEDYATWDIALEVGLAGADYSRQSMVVNDVVGMDSIITNIDAGSSERIYVVGDIVVLEVLFKNRAALSNPGATNDIAQQWSSASPDPLMSDPNNATDEQVKLMVKEYGSGLSSSLNTATPSAYLTPFSNTP